MNEFAPNLIQTSRIRSVGTFTLKTRTQQNHTENHKFGHNSAIIARICTEFEIQAENGVPQTDLPPPVITGNWQM